MVEGVYDFIVKTVVEATGEAKAGTECKEEKNGEMHAVDIFFR